MIPAPRRHHSLVGLTCGFIALLPLTMSACRSIAPAAEPATAKGSSVREARTPTTQEVASGRRALIEADAHMHASRWRAAADAYAEALHLLPEESQAVRGLRSALSRLDERSGLDRVANEWSILHQQTVRLFDRRLESARGLLEREEMDAAERTVIHARVELERNREYLSESEHGVRQRAAEDLLQQVGLLRERVAQSRRGG